MLLVKRLCTQLTFGMMLFNFQEDYTGEKQQTLLNYLTETDVGLAAYSEWYMGLEVR